MTLDDRPTLSLPVFPLWAHALMVLAVAGTLTYFSIRSVPGSGSVQTGPFGLFPISAWLHFFAYGGLALALAYATQHLPWPTWQVLGVVFVVTVCYGIGIELLQSVTPGRTFSYRDMAVNAIGAGVALGCWRAMLAYVRFYQVDPLAPIETN